MQYRYVGPGPQEDRTGGVVRPGDVRDFGTEPDWGPWELEGGTGSPAGAEATQPPAPAPERPAVASQAPVAATPAGQVS